MDKLLRILYFPISWILLIFYKRCKYQDRIREDYLAFEKVNNSRHAESVGSAANVTFGMIYHKFISYAEFRSLVYFRFGKFSKLIKWLFPHPQVMLSFDLPRENLGGGLYLQHGYCTDLSARKIGNNCWINQKVTIGYRGDNCPIIGNNVRIGVGAIIIGDVTVGDNATIAAGAIVVKDVPSNTTVVEQPARYISRNK